MTFIEWLILGIISEAAYQQGKHLETSCALATHKLIFSYMRSLS